MLNILTFLTWDIFKHKNSNYRYFCRRNSESSKSCFKAFKFVVWDKILWGKCKGNMRIEKNAIKFLTANIYVFIYILIVVMSKKLLWYLYSIG